MAGIVPNTGATYARQAVLDTVDLEAIQMGSNLTGVVSGCATTTAGGVMTVAVAAGVVRIAGKPVTVSGATSAAMTSDGSNPKWYLVTVSTAGAIVVTAGTAAADPKLPAIPATSVVVAAVYLPTGVSAITAAMIVDKRVTVPFPTHIDPEWYGAVGYGSEAAAAAGTDSGPAINLAIIAAATSAATNGGPAKVLLQPKFYGFATQLVLYRGCVIEGSGTDRDRGGSTLVAQAGLGTDGLITDVNGTSEWTHQAGIRNLQWLFSRQTAGSGLRIWKAGENFVLDRIQVSGAFGAGIWSEGNATPLNFGHLTVFGCGRGLGASGQSAGVYIDFSPTGTGNTAGVIAYISGDDNYGPLVWAKNLAHATLMINGFKSETRTVGRHPYILVNEDSKGGKIKVNAGFVYTEAGVGGTAILYGKRTSTSYPTTLPSYFDIGAIGGYDSTAIGLPAYTYGYTSDDATMPNISTANLMRQMLVQGVSRFTSPNTSTTPTMNVQGHLAFIDGDTISARIYTGTGAPAFAAENGSMYLRQDGAAGTTIYVRAGGAWSANA